MLIYQRCMNLNLATLRRFKSRLFVTVKCEKPILISKLLCIEKSFVFQHSLRRLAQLVCSLNNC